MKFLKSSLILGTIFLMILSLFNCNLFKPGDSEQLFEPPEDLNLEPATCEKLVDLVKANNGDEVTLNLANDDEYTYLNKRLSFSGKTKNTSPYLFQLIEEKRERDLSRFFGDREDERDSVPDGNGHIMVKYELTEQETLIASAYGSVLEGSEYLFIDVVAWDKDWKHITQYSWDEKYDAPVAEATSEGDLGISIGDANNRSKLPPSSLTNSNADTLLIYRDENGEIIISYTNRKSSYDIIYPKYMILEHPREEHDDYVNYPADNIITVCLDRAWPQDCDYYLSGTNKTVLMPFKGEIDFVWPIVDRNMDGKPDEDVVDDQGDLIRKIDLSLSTASTGGLEKKMNDMDFWNHPNTRIVNNTKLAWDMSDIATLDCVNFGTRAFATCADVNFFVAITVPLREPTAASNQTGLPGTAFVIPEDYYNETDYIYKPFVTDMELTANEEHTLRVIGKDNDDNWQTGSNATQYKWTVDTEAPLAQLFNLPPTQTRAKQFSISVGGTDVVFYSYQLDVILDGNIIPGNPSLPVSISKPILYDNSDDDFGMAIYSLAVYGIDRAGNKQATPVTYLWQSTPTILSGAEAVFDVDTLPAAQTNSTTLDISVTGIDLTAYRYQLNDGTVNDMNIDDNIVEAGLADGTYTLSIWGSIDGINYQTTATQFTWTIDLTAPEAVLNCALPSEDPTISADYLTVDVVGEGVIAYQYSLDNENGPFSAVTSTDTLITLTELTEAPHILYVKGIDNAGNIQSDTATLSWTIDYTAKNVILTGLPRTYTNSLKCNIEVKGDFESFMYRFVPDDWGDEYPLKDYMKMPKLEFVWSCIAEDSLILMADGSTKPVSDVAEGDVVLSGAIGKEGSIQDQKLTVKGVASGKESESMFRIYDDLGHSLLITKGHPVLLADNTIKLTKDLVVDDQIVTDRGIGRIIQIDKEMYYGDVYNLVLGEKTESIDDLLTGYSMYADGILVGDYMMQKILQFKDKEKKGSLFDRLPKVWHKDIENSLKLKKNK